MNRYELLEAYGNLFVLIVSVCIIIAAACGVLQ